MRDLARTGWEFARVKGDARYLQQKKHPARTAAKVVREKGREMAELRRRMKLAEYITALYEFHFPWLADFRDVEAELDYATSAEGDEGIQLNALKSVPNPVVEDRVLPRRAGGAPR